MSNPQPGEQLPPDPWGWLIPFRDGLWWPVSASDEAWHLEPQTTKEAAVSAIHEFEVGLDEGIDRG